MRWYLYRAQLFVQLKRWSALLGVFSLVACSGVPLNLDDTRLNGLLNSSTIPNISYYPQIEDQCGPSSLATMLDFQGVDISPEALKGKVYIPGKEGAVTTEIIARARQYGLLVYPLEPNLINILTEINAGNPVLVMQNLGFDWLPAWHFSVAFGYDLERQKISLRSGTEFKKELTFRLFQRTWERADSWAIIIVQPSRLPQTAKLDAIIRSANHLEQVGEVRAAHQAYRAVLSKWPDSSIATFGAGNTAYALADYDSAKTFFSSYVRLEPSSSKGWNNLAYSLAELGCVVQANIAMECALNLEPDDQNLGQSVQDISQMTTKKSHAKCESIKCVKR